MCINTKRFLNITTVGGLYMSNDIYICNDCNKTFKSKRALQGHSRMHGPSNGKLIHPKICCIETREIIEVRFFENHLKKLLPCKNCQKIFKSKYNSVFCSRSCAGYYNNTPSTTQYMNDYKKYRNQAEFKFNLMDYPDYFEFDLLIKFRMYDSIKNPNGISRDHIFSIKDGFDQQINPLIIAHPANCQLMRQNGINGNGSKGSKSNISIVDLLENIDHFNAKYIYD